MSDDPKFVQGSIRQLTFGPDRTRDAKLAHEKGVRLAAEVSQEIIDALGARVAALEAMVRRLVENIEARHPDFTPDGYYSDAERDAFSLFADAQALLDAKPGEGT